MKSTTSQMTRLIAAAIAQVTGETINLPQGTLGRVFQATVTGTGAVGATVIIEGSNDGEHFSPIATITLTDTTTDTDFAASVVPWPSVRARLTAISGTNASVDVTMGI